MGVLHTYIGKDITAVRPKVGELQGHCTQSSKYLDVELEQGPSWTLEGLEKVVISTWRKAHSKCHEQLVCDLTHVFQILMCSQLYGNLSAVLERKHS